METIQSPITTIPGIGLRMGAMILAEISDFSRFNSPDKILAYVGLSPSTYQSGQLSMNGAYSYMEKRGSRHIRYSIYNATKYVCLWEPSFAAKKRTEGKHYNVALSHAAKSLYTLSTLWRGLDQAFRSVAYSLPFIFSFRAPHDALFLMPFFTSYQSKISLFRNLTFNS